MRSFQLSPQECEQIAVMLKAGANISEVSRALDRTRQTVHRFVVRRGLEQRDAMTPDALIAAADTGTPMDLPRRVNSKTRAVILSAIRVLVEQRDMTVMSAGRLLGMTRNRVYDMVRDTDVKSSRAAVAVANAVSCARGLEVRQQAYKIRLEAATPVIVSMRQKGTSIVAIAQATGIDKPVIVRVIAEAGMPTRRVRKERPAREKLDAHRDDEAIREMRVVRRMSVALIAETLGRKQGAIQRALNRLRLPTVAMPAVTKRQPAKPKVAKPAQPYRAFRPEPVRIVPLDAAEAAALVDAKLADKQQRARDMLRKRGADPLDVARIVGIRASDCYRIAGELRRERAAA